MSVTAPVHHLVISPYSLALPLVIQSVIASLKLLSVISSPGGTQAAAATEAWYSNQIGKPPVASVSSGVSAIGAEGKRGKYDEQQITHGGGASFQGTSP